MRPRYMGRIVNTYVSDKVLPSLNGLSGWHLANLFRDSIDIRLRAALGPNVQGNLPIETPCDSQWYLGRPRA
jgi:hypothetical protein